MLKRNGIPSAKTVARKGYAKSPKRTAKNPDASDAASTILLFTVAGTLAALVQMGVI